jgi:protein TonB
METKKSKRADLEPKKSIFLQVGLIVALGLSLAAFEWKTPVKEIVVTSTSWETVQEDLYIKNPVIVDQKPAPIPVVAPAIRIVDNNTAVTEDILIDTEINPEDSQPVYIAPVQVQLEDEKSLSEEETFIIVEKMPEYPGGIGAMHDFLVKNIEFPKTAVETGIKGTVYLYFIVEKDGSISNIKIIRGIGGGCDQEAERVISKMPKWNPGSQRGKPVRVSFNIPVVFDLK